MGRRTLLAFLFLCGSIAFALTGFSQEPVTLENYLRRLGYAPIRLSVGDNNHFFLHGKINGKKVRLSLDTGCAITRLIPKAASGLTPIDPKKVSIDDGFLNRTHIPGLVLMDTLELGGLQFRNQPAHVGEIEFDFVRSVDDGLLGCDFLARNHCIIDCGHGLLFVRGEALPSQAETSLKETLLKSGFKDTGFEVSPGRPVTCHVALNKKDYGLIVDTGCPWTLLDWECGQQLGLTALVRPRHLVMNGIGKVGAHGLQEAQLQTLQIGDLTLARIYVALADMSAWGLTERGQWMKNQSGFLGMETLASTAALLDFGTRTIWVHPAFH